jgi:hypothetical protein
MPVTATAAETLPPARPSWVAGAVIGSAVSNNGHHRYYGMRQRGRRRDHRGAIGAIAGGAIASSNC